MHLPTNKNLHSLLQALMLEASRSHEQPSYQSAGLWWQHIWQQNRVAQDKAQQIIELAFKAPNFSCAFVAAYQSALQLMFPQLPATANLACLCVSEKAGNSPKAIDCALKDQKVNGEKTFVTCANAVDTLLVMIDDQTSVQQHAKKSLRLMQIDKVQTLLGKGLQVSLSEFNAEKFLPDIGKGNLLLRDFPIDQAVLLSGEAHEVYSKPFSVLEGLCIRLSMCAHLLKWACVYQWPKPLQADLLLQLSALTSALQSSAQSALTQVLVDAQHRLMEKLVTDIDSEAEKHPVFKTHWQRDKLCLFMDFRLREKRLSNAWFELNVAATPN